MANPIFSTQHLALKSAGLALFFAVIFMITDKKHPEITHGIREQIHAAMSPLYSIAEGIRYSMQSMSYTLTSKATIQRENMALKAKLMQANTYLQTYAQLSTENARLRGILSAPTPVDGRVDIAAVIGIDNNPLRQILVLNRGKNHGVYVGQTVLDEAGIMGQIINVYPNNSRALLISDTQHALGVKTQRTGQRAVATGHGDNGTLTLQFVPNTADIQVGDKVVSSGLGKRFPAGYMVGEVSYIDRTGANEFLDVKLKPSANLQDDTYVMLLVPSQPIRLAKQKQDPDDAIVFDETQPLEADTQSDHQSNIPAPSSTPAADTALPSSDSATTSTQATSLTTQPAT